MTSRFCVVFFIGLGLRLQANRGFQAWPEIAVFQCPQTGGSGRSFLLFFAFGFCFLIAVSVLVFQHDSSIIPIPVPVAEK